MFNIENLEGIQKVSDRSDIAEKLTSLDNLVRIVGFWLVVVLPHMVIQRLPARAEALADDIAEFEVLLVHHAVSTVDNTGTNGCIVPCCPGCHKLQFHPKVFIKPGKTSPARILDILQFLAFSKQIPQGFFIDIHLLQDVPDVAGCGQREQQAGE